MTNKLSIDGAAAKPMDAYHAMIELQREQVSHDEGFHKEIVRLTTQHRLAHIALHLAKYNCRFQLDWDCQDVRERTVTDALIMCISGLSMLNIRISDAWNIPKNVSEFEFAQKIKETFGNSNRSFCEKFAGATLKAVAAAEKLDHVEVYNFRETFIEAFSEAGSQCFIRLVDEGHTPTEAVRKRLLTVKNKSIFYEA